MRTQAVIASIIGGLAAASTATFVALVWWQGWTLAVVMATVVCFTVAASYRFAIRPWHLRWGATDDEVGRPMPGDELLPDADSVTRAISIDATADEVWPWLVQLGYGKAGWYSYDWIDNDGVPSADRVLTEHQNLAVGGRILMMPTMGFGVREIVEPSHIVSVLEDGSTSWCLALHPDGDGVRLVSRWRPTVDRSLGGMAMLAVVEPGTFIMEQKMLRTIRQRVEAARTNEVMP